MQHILIVDDDLTLRNRLRKFLETEGYRVNAVGDGVALRKQMQGDLPDLVIMDLQLPGEDGLSLTRHLREHTDVAVLILTGKGHTIDRVVGLEMGADDYLAKPFSLRELIARIRSILRRTGAAGGTGVRAGGAGGQGAGGRAPARVRFGGWTMDFAKVELLGEDGRPVHLTAAEFRLLEALVRNAGRTLSRDRLVDALADRSWQPMDRSADLHISHLRRKIERDPSKPELIKTVRGFGYVFTGTPETG